MKYVYMVERISPTQLLIPGAFMTREEAVRGKQFMESKTPFYRYRVLEVPVYCTLEEAQK